MVEVELESKLLDSVTQSFWLLAAPWTAGCQASLPLTISQSSPKFMSTASVMPSGHLILWCPLLFLTSVFPSIRDFSNEFAVRITWPKHWSFNFSISASNQCSGLISLKIDRFDLAVHGALRSLFQHHRLKASVLWHHSKFLSANSHILSTMACYFCFPTFLTPYFVVSCTKALYICSTYTFLRFDTSTKQTWMVCIGWWTTQEQGLCLTILMASAI